MRTRVDRIRDFLVGTWAVLALVYLFVPIFVIVLFSFNDNKGRFNFTWQGFTLKHWQDPFKYPQLEDAFLNSLTVAAVATLISVALGVFVALALVRYRWRGRGVVNSLVFLPLATPEVVLGAALLGWFLTLTFARGFATVVIAHVMFTLGYVVITIRARLEGMDLHIEEAAMDLGASQMTTIRKVTLPLIMPGVVAAGLLAFAISIDDFVVTNFTAGPYQTFPLFVYGAARQGVPPQVNVLATALLVVAIVGMFVNLAVQRRAARRDAGVIAAPAVAQ